ncbi:hypothetical protein MKW92_005630 [Papaver armeniacum]|nr:hypothetical protein MKW92_005630 [Papaver armeniacum]
MNYFEEDILDQANNEADIDDVNKFINLGIKEHGDNYDGDGTSLLSCSSINYYYVQLGWLSGNVSRLHHLILTIKSNNENIIWVVRSYIALVLLHKSYPSNKSTGTWSYFETHLPQHCANGDFAQVEMIEIRVSRRRGLPPNEHLPSWDKVDVVYESIQPLQTWCCRYDLKTPKQNDRVCGVFSFKFIEHMVRKIPVCQVQPDFATRYRCDPCGAAIQETIHRGEWHKW